MDDETIINLYWARDERAIAETSSKYGGLCNHIAGNILSSREDREECISDTYLAVWNAIPDKHPNRFSVFISRIVRNLALKKYEYISAAKRNPSAVASLDELDDCVSGTDSIESEIEERHIENAINQFLWHLDEEKRNIFIRRYWYLDSIEAICKCTGFSRSKVNSMLYEMRRKLRLYLESEGVEI